MKMLCKWMPWFFLALFAMEIVAVLMPKKDGEFHIRKFGQLPVLLNGRVQPFDSVGRNTLLQIRSTADVPLEEVPSWKFWHHAAKLKSTEWLLEVMFRPEQADQRSIFLIHHPDLLGELKLEGKGTEKEGLHYFSLADLKPVLPEIRKQGSMANKVDDKLRNAEQKQVAKLFNAVVLYQGLKRTLQIPGAKDDLNTVIDELDAAMLPGIQAIKAKESGAKYDEAAYDQLVGMVNQFDELQQDPNGGQLYPLAIPPIQPEVARDDWGNLGAGMINSVRDRAIFPPVRWLATASAAYHNQNAGVFNQAVSDYGIWLKDHLTPEMAKGRHEFFYNDFKGFLHATIIYLFAFVLACGALLTLGTATNLSEALRRSSFYLVMLAWCVHTFALVFRMVLEGRPPVTNLYSSAIFIGWGAVVLGMILEAIFRLGLGSAVAALAGAITLLIAHNLAVGGDTMEMLRAVLDTNFWLATHVVVVTLGYASTFFAGLLAIFYVLLGLLTPVLSIKLRPAASVTKGKAKVMPNPLDVGKVLSKMIYAIVCFATLFSFVGTVLGGIWADQSWGRFWGWDPKENGALLIVIWNATILHARWGGMIRERGLANLAIVGNIVTSWSWFGVNMLGIGLHSYGFMDAAFKWLVLFIVIQLVLIGLGLLPKRYWRSFNQDVKTEPGPISGGKGKTAGARA